jgi:hypothetical protein
MYEFIGASNKLCEGVNLFEIKGFYASTLEEEVLELKELYNCAINLMGINRLKFKHSKRVGDKYLYKLFSNAIEVLENSRDAVNVEYVIACKNMPEYLRAPGYFTSRFKEFFYGVKYGSSWVNDIMQTLFRIEEYYLRCE